MTFLLLLRHAPTAWNEARRIQGRTDEPLSEKGRRLAAEWSLPGCFGDFSWTSSPLARCRETARLMGGGDVAVEPRLIEMAWGAWEGRTLDSLRREHGAAMDANEARGLDFTPPGGESPRMVQMRLLPYFAKVAAEARPRIAVTHRGVIRATVALASGWDMKAEAPVKIARYAAHLFSLSPAGMPRIERLNIPLQPPPAGAA